MVFLKGMSALQYAFNLFSHNSPMTGNGYNEEEMKMVKETKKIWGSDDIAITATCIRRAVKIYWMGLLIWSFSS